MIDSSFLHGVLNGTNSRFTEEQLKSYDAYGENIGLRARCLSGAFIALKSKSKAIEITLKIRGRARNYLGLDVEVDRIIKKSIRMELSPDIDILSQRLVDFSEEKPREIRVYLPVSVEIEIVSFTAQGAPLPKPDRKILCLGDSITQGMDSVSPLCTYPVIVAKILEADLLNQGVGGHIFDPLTFDPSIPFEPEIITVAYGVNDWNKDITAKKIRESASQFLEEVRKRFPKSLIVVITPIWTNRESEKKCAGRLQDVRDIIEKAAKKTGCTPINGLSLVPNDMFYFVDGIHPNETGHLAYGINLASCITKLIP